MQTPWAIAPGSEQASNTEPNTLPAREPQLCVSGAAPVGDDERTIPFVTLSGHWLSQLGFDVGVAYQLHARPGGITLSVVRPAAPAITVLGVPEGEADASSHQRDPQREASA